MWLEDLLPLNLPHKDGFMIWGIFTPCPACDVLLLLSMQKLQQKEQ